MEWEKETEELFGKIVEQMPEGFRPSVTPLIIKAAEQRCLDRNGAYINDADVITGIFDIIPEAFKPIMVEDLKSFTLSSRKLRID